MWLVNQPQPDTENAVRAVARYANMPTEVHASTAINIMRVYVSTSDCGITFHKGSGLELVAFADEDYANVATDKRSLSGGAVMCAGACVC